MMEAMLRFSLRPAGTSVGTIGELLSQTRLLTALRWRSSALLRTTLTADLTLSSRSVGTQPDGAHPTVPNDDLRLLDPRALSLDSPTHMIWGANTDVGKTVISSGLALAACQRPDPLNVLYVKPVQTGYPTDCDARFVRQNASRALKVASIVDGWERRAPLPLLVTVSLFQWEPPVSPHVAARENPVPDNDVITAVRTALREGRTLRPGPKNTVSPQQIISVENFGSETCSILGSGSGSGSGPGSETGLRERLSDSGPAEQALSQVQARLGTELRRKWITFVETAGGPASPGPSGSLQCDIYRPLRLPGVLVGDGRLGGISATVAAYETLLMRGYDTDCVVLVDHGLGNPEAIDRYMRGNVPVVALPPMPTKEQEAAGGPGIDGWLYDNRRAFGRVLDILENGHVGRLERLRTMGDKAGDILWWPFTQHGLVGRDDVTVIDSRCGDEFSVYSGRDRIPSPEAPPSSGSNGAENDHVPVKAAAVERVAPNGALPNLETLNPSFDACASWWTQGVSLEGQLAISRAVAYAVGRYGHVMFPENVHEPALALAEKLLKGVGKGWADRVFYSDNGSTAIEIAIKMAFRKYTTDHGLLDQEPPPDLYVLALDGSYHGDTLGAMEAQASTPYTGPRQQPWYRGRGCFLRAPKVECSRGRWKVTWENGPNTWENGGLERVDYGSREEVFRADRGGNAQQAEAYKRYIVARMAEFEKGAGADGRAARLGGLILEPVLHGAGGMELIDPLFQRTLIEHCKAERIPVILDEVFAGIWRLGRETAAELLGCTPDIACYAKLLTGGALPLAVTLATEDVFKTFLSDNKLEALLHGHSYTAHVAGCAAALAALDIFINPSQNPNYDPRLRAMQEMWDPSLVSQMSFLPQVTRVVALGTVFAVELRTRNAGYGSLETRQIVVRLRERGVFCRSLGNVMYLMCSPMTKVEKCSQLLGTLKEEIERT